MARKCSSSLLSAGEPLSGYLLQIAGPTRSGSTWHVDPNHTSAWNAVTVGEKAWIMFPPDVTPPGVYASEDGAQVEAPLSLAEWFLSYYEHAKRVYGPRTTDSATRGKMREGICRAGEILYVPSGWWHSEYFPLVFSSDPPPPHPLHVRSLSPTLH